MTVMDRPSVKTPLPGPKSKALIEYDEKFVSPSYTRAYPVVLDRAEGAWIWDVDGNKYLDFHSGIGVCSTGNTHPKVVEAIVAQARKSVHFSSADFYHELVGSLAERIGKHAPGDKPKRVFFTNSGTESVECGLKLARYKRRRPRMIAFIGAFHGRSMGALSLTCSKIAQRERFSPLLPEVTHVPYAYCYRCPFNLKYPDCKLACVSFIEEQIFARVAPADDVAAIVVEPIQGEGGYIVPPPDYFQALHALAKKYSIMLMVDEVQSGMGKTGKMFAIQHFNVVPDIITIAKAIASGVPLGACVAPADVMDWPPGAHSTTFGGNPIACAAAHATLDLLEGGLIDNARVQGEFLMTELKKLQAKHPSMGDVRGIGLMIGIEFVRDKVTKVPAKEVAADVEQMACRKGMMLLTCGPNGIRLVPPLVITREQCQVAIEILDDVIGEAERKHKIG
ncbi:MAG TPA: acetyl ornithine aminotransferase family protein [bacterium]|nr:acetyl ornithine aminotransferase family protein [bacterium]